MQGDWKASTKAAQNSNKLAGQVIKKILEKGKQTNGSFVLPCFVFSGHMYSKPFTAVSI